MSAGHIPEAQLNAVDSRGRRLAVHFNWQGDRYAHSICAAERGVWRPLLESVEGTGEDFWPPSPPFQSLNEPRIESDSSQGQVTMLVGAAGKSHWAMTVTPRYHWIGQPGWNFETEIVFDVACRIKDSPSWLGSSYRVLAGQTAISEELQVVRVPADPAEILVMPEIASVQLDTLSGTLPIVRCEASLPLCESPTETVRWRYAVRLCSARD